MSFTEILTLIQRIIDIVLGVMGLLLVLRLVLHWFKLPPSHPVLRGLTWLTDPLLGMAYRLLGIPTYSPTLRLNLQVDWLKVLATLLLLWAAHSILTWMVQLLAFMAFFATNPLGALGQLLLMLINLVFELYTLALVLRVLFEWLRMSYTGRVMHFLWKITEPLLASVRRLLPPLGGWDFSPIIAFLLVGFMRQIVLMLLSWIF